MPLMIMSPNGAEMDSPSNRKRSHEEYSEDAGDDMHVAIKDEPAELHQVKMEPSDIGTSIPSHLSRASPPAQSSPAALTDAGSSPLGGGVSTSPNTPTRQPLQPVTPAPQNNTLSSSQPTTTKTVLANGQGPPAKRKRLTPAEKQAKDAAEAAEKAEKERIKQAQKQAKEAEEAAKKAARQAEMEAKKKLKEQKDREKKEEKEQKEREKKEEAERKLRAQPRIGAFFKKDPVPPKPAQATLASDPAKSRSPSPAATQSEYEKLAIPFFVHNNVTLAKNPFGLDEETREAKTAIMTDYLAGRRSPFSTKPFDPVKSLQVPAAPPRRGKSYPRVRDLVSDLHGGMPNPIDDLFADSKKLPNQRSLKKIPMKQLSFHEDVRPGYFGTVTSVQSVAALKKMGRNPIAKDLPLNYDYDSEAEWVQGDEEEEGEGLEDTDDEEDDDDDPSMHEFLDDSEDVRRGPLMPVSSMEPETSGICFEDRHRRNPNPQMYKFRMEFMIPNLERSYEIDPFSTAYWPLDSKVMTANAISGLNIKSKATKAQTAESIANSAMAPPPAPKTSAVTPTAAPASADLIPPHLMDDFKKVVLDFKFLPKSGMIPTLAHKFDKCKKAQIQATLDYVAEKPKKKGDWQLKQGV